MGMFDDQIKERKLHDDELFAEAISGVAGAVVGGKLAAALKSGLEVARNAIEDVLHFYGIKPSEIPDGMEDINEQLEYQLRPSGITRRVINLDKGWYKVATGAILGTRKDNGNIVAFIPGHLGGYTFKDETTGKKVWVNSINEKLFDKEAVAFYKPFPLRKIAIPDLIKFMVSCLSVQDVLLMILFMGMTSVVGLMIPKINNMIFGVLIDSGSISWLMSMAVLFACINISSLLFSVNSTFISTRISTKLEMSVNGATMMRIMSLPADFFKNYSSGELTSYSGYMSNLCEMLISSVTSVGLTALFSLIYISSIFEYAPGLVAPAITITLVTLAFTIISSLMQMKISKQTMEYSAKETGLSYALISGVQKLKLAGAEKRAFSKWAHIYSKEAALTYNPPAFIKINSAISTAITAVGTIIMYYVAIKTNVTVSEYYAFNSAYGMVSTGFSALAGIALEIAQIRPILDMVKPIMDAEPEVSENKTVVTKVRGDIELSNVSFRYSDDMPYVINNMSLHIHSGEYIAIVGKTGCGKSTLMRLLLGFEKPNKGAIYYDKKDINKLDLKSLRRKIGVVLQNGKLFNDDIFSNITISAPYLTMDDAWEAAEIAGIADDIRKMPMGMFTLIGEGSGGVSGGQKQRLMIARAVAPKPKILMFDEATSALDNITQKKVSEALDKMKCTRIVIAHRLSTIRQCDRIIYLEDGRIKEDGTYDELIAKNGLFASLVKRQRIDEDAE